MALNACAILAFILGINGCMEIMRNSHQYWLRPANVLNVEYDRILSESLFKDGGLSTSFESAFMSGLGKRSVFAKAVFPVEDFASFNDSVGKWTHSSSNAGIDIKQAAEDFLPVFNVDMHKIRSVRLANAFFCRIIIMEPRGDKIYVYVRAEIGNTNFGVRLNALFPDR